MARNSFGPAMLAAAFALAVILAGCGGAPARSEAPGSLPQAPASSEPADEVPTQAGSRPAPSLLHEEADGAQPGQSLGMMPNAETLTALLGGTCWNSPDGWAVSVYREGNTVVWHDAQGGLDLVSFVTDVVWENDDTYTLHLRSLLPETGSPFAAGRSSSFETQRVTLDLSGLASGKIAQTARGGQNGAEEGWAATAHGQAGAGGGDAVEYTQGEELSYTGSTDEPLSAEEAAAKWPLPEKTWPTLKKRNGKMVWSGDLWKIVGGSEWLDEESGTLLGFSTTGNLDVVKIGRMYSEWSAWLVADIKPAGGKAYTIELVSMASPAWGTAPPYYRTITVDFEGCEQGTVTWITDENGPLPLRLRTEW